MTHPAPKVDRVPAPVGHSRHNYMAHLKTGDSFLLEPHQHYAAIMYAKRHDIKVRSEKQDSGQIRIHILKAYDHAQ